MICPRCHSQVADGVKFCGVCGSPMPTGQTPPPPQQSQNPYGPPPQNPYGAPPPQGQYRGQQQPDGSYVPPNQYEEYINSPFGSAVPRAELHNPKGDLRIGDMTIHIDGELVPVVDIMLGNQLPIYFEHHILLCRRGLFIDQFTARGGEGMVLLHGYGNVFEKMLAPGETLDVEPGAWLWKDPSVQMTVTTVAGSQRGGGIFGAIGGLMAGASIILNRFTGPGRLGIQSMTYHPPQPEGAQQAGGQQNLDLGQLFNS